MLGNRIREARVARSLSLNDVASRAKISVATLSRIERDKQGVDLAMFMTLSRVLKMPVHELFGETDGESSEPLAVRIASLSSRDRVTFWHDLAGERSKHRNGRKQAIRKLADEVEELLAQIEFLRTEIEAVQKRLRTR